MAVGSGVAGVVVDASGVLDDAFAESIGSKSGLRFQSVSGDGVQNVGQKAMFMCTDGGIGGDSEGATRT